MTHRPSAPPRPRANRFPPLLGCPASRPKAAARAARAQRPRCRPLLRPTTWASPANRTARSSTATPVAASRPASCPTVGCALRTAGVDPLPPGTVAPIEAAAVADRPRASAGPSIPCRASRPAARPSGRSIAVHDKSTPRPRPASCDARRRSAYSWPSPTTAPMSIASCRASPPSCRPCGRHRPAPWPTSERCCSPAGTSVRTASPRPRQRIPSPPGLRSTRCAWPLPPRPGGPSSGSSARTPRRAAPRPIRRPS